MFKCLLLYTTNEHLCFTTSSIGHRCYTCINNFLLRHIRVSPIDNIGDTSDNVLQNRSTCLQSDIRFFRNIAQHDIAILKLATPLVFNEKVSAVKLPPQNEVETGNAVLSGWGSISKNLLPKLPAVLQKVTIPILDNASCLAKFPKNIIGKQPEIYDTQICTGSVKGESACSVRLIDAFYDLNSQSTESRCRILPSSNYRRKMMPNNICLKYFFCTENKPDKERERVCVIRHI